MKLILNNILKNYSGNNKEDYVNFKKIYPIVKFKEVQLIYKWTMYKFDYNKNSMLVAINLLFSLIKSKSFTPEELNKKDKKCKINGIFVPIREGIGHNICEYVTNVLEQKHDNAFYSYFFTLLDENITPVYKKYDIGFLSDEGQFKIIQLFYIIKDEQLKGMMMDFICNYLSTSIRFMTKTEKTMLAHVVCTMSKKRQDKFEKYVNKKIKDLI